MPNLEDSAIHNASEILKLQPFILYSTNPQHKAFHNLCTTEKPPWGLHNLLGLGLKFCLQEKRTTILSDQIINKFKRDAFLQFFFSGNPHNNNNLFPAKSQWTPPLSDISEEFQLRINHFIQILKIRFQQEKSPSNLLPRQEELIEYLKTHPNLMIVKSDKNLGPVIIERTTYIKRALSNHLLDTSTYR